MGTHTAAAAAATTATRSSGASGSVRRHMQMRRHLRRHHSRISSLDDARLPVFLSPFLSFFLSFSTKRPAARAVEEAEGGDSWPGSSVLSDVPGASITATSRAHTECCLGENGGAVPPAATRRYRNLQMTFLIWLRRDN